MKIEEGDEVLLYVDERRKYLIKVEKGKSFSTDKGTIKLDELIGLRYGSAIKLNQGEGYILKPSLIDLYRGGLRPSQVIYPKDIGYMILYSGIGPGSVILEAGTGSGYLTAALAHFVGETGKVYSYDMREDMQSKAEKNLKRLGLRERVELKLGDIREGVPENNVDAVFLDMPDPWNAIDAAKRSLKYSGSVLAFVPTIRQVELTYIAMDQSGFIDLRADHLLLTEIRVKQNATRPKNVGVLHTGYIVFGRKTEKKSLRESGEVEVQESIKGNGSMR
jgi:tRNA (adenine57-N1/adenine58-N1)-methyltransferase